MSASLVQPAGQPEGDLADRPEAVSWAPHARKRLGDVLVAAGVISAEELMQALEAQRAVIGARRRLGHVLVDMGVCTEKQIAAALGEQLHLQVVDLRQIALSPDTVRLLPRTSRSGSASSSSRGTALGLRSRSAIPLTSWPSTTYGCTRGHRAHRTRRETTFDEVARVSPRD